MGRFLLEEQGVEPARAATHWLSVGVVVVRYNIAGIDVDVGVGSGLGQMTLTGRLWPDQDHHSRRHLKRTLLKRHVGG